MPILDRRRLGLGLLALAPALGHAPTARAAGRVVTVASLFGPDTPETRIWLRIREQVNARLPGQFDIRIVQNAALGGEKEVAEGVRLGSIQGGIATMSILSTWLPEAQILDAPFVFRDGAHVRRVLDGPLGTEFRGKFAQQGFVVPAYINYGARQLLAKEAITLPSQLKGKRIRAIQSPLHTELWRAYGANPTPIPITDTYNALKSGVVDMMDLTKGPYVAFKLNEVVPYLIETGHIWATGAVYFSPVFWRALKPEQQAVFSDVVAEAALYFDQLVVASEAEAVSTALAAGGHHIVPQDLEAWRQGARPVWNSLAPKVGGLGRIEALAAA
jgi:TRAP-type C4-dicarboxylate transport system substrate-binding protein